MKRARHARAAVVCLASVSLLGLPLGGAAAVAQTGGEREHARYSPPAGVVMKGNNNGARDDRLYVNAINNKAGAAARLFRREDREWIKVARGVLNDQGNIKFVAEDLNGRSRTKYLVRVAATEETARQRAKVRVR